MPARPVVFLNGQQQEQPTEACDNYEPGTFREPEPQPETTHAGPEQIVLQGYLSDQGPFNEQFTEYCREGWQPTEFCSHPCQTEDGPDLMLVRVMVNPG